ncbi:twin-arginine translocase TatA/TatE family subunit [Pseudonocardia acidicola]|uniref:twin-arginine translocase TatA/TatE family subunit n=1 Tax=Pseudonocardia acidicola TaxID=2724939 RepID=UPI0030843E67
MFDLSIEKLFVLGLAALFILGPERLPGAAAWLGRTIRQLRSYAGDANQKLRSELGPEFDELRRPLQDLGRELGGVSAMRDPRRAVLRHLLDDGTNTGTNTGTGAATDAAPRPVDREPAAPQPPLARGERPPIDPEAT